MPFQMLFRVQIITVLVVAGCTATIAEDSSSLNDALAKNSREKRYIDPAWDLSPSVGLLRSTSFGTATLTRLEYSFVSSSIVVTSAHQFAFQDWDPKPQEPPHFMVFTVPRPRSTQLPQSYIDIVVPLRRARVLAHSEASVVESAYKNDIAVAELAYQLGPEHLGLQPIPVIATRQPPAAANFHAWFLGYGANRCEAQTHASTLQGAGIKRAASFEWPGPDRHILVFRRNRLEFDRRTQVAPCPMDSGGPYVVASDAGAPQGYVGAWPSVSYRLDSIVAIAAAAQQNRPDSEDEWGPTFAADVVGYRSWIEENASQATEVLPPIEELVSCPTVEHLSPHHLPFTTQSFCSQVQDLDAFCASKDAEADCTRPYCDWRTCHQGPPRCAQAFDFTPC
jgi:hypothetical protein